MDRAFEAERFSDRQSLLLEPKASVRNQHLSTFLFGLRFCESVFDTLIHSNTAHSHSCGKCCSVLPLRLTMPVADVLSNGSCAESRWFHGQV